MLPDLLLLVALILGVNALGEPGGPVVDALKPLAGTAAAVLVVVSLCRMAADRALRALEERDAEEVLAAGRWTATLPFLGWATVLFVFDWGEFVGQQVPRTWYMVPHLVLLAPLAAMVAAGWAAQARVEARLDPRQSAAPKDAFGRGVRRNAVILVPLLVVTGIVELFYVLDALKVPGFRTLFLWHEAFPDVEAVLVLAVLVVLTWLGPEIFRRVLRAKPLADGERRRQIERLCAAIGVRCRDFLLWDTKGRVLNAMVVGITARTRYVFVTDGLLDTLPEAEMLAVVAHEAGHAKRYHLPAYFVLSLAMLLLMRSAEELVLPYVPHGGDLALALLFLGFFWFVMLGWLSRKFEREADVFGAEHAGALSPGAEPVTLPILPAPLPYGAAMMISALHRIVGATGGGRHHRHGPPTARMAFIAAHATREAVREQFRRDARRVRLGVLAIALLALGTTAARVPGGLVRGASSLAFQEGVEEAEAAKAARKAGDVATARRRYDRAYERFTASARRLDERPSDAKLRAQAAVATFDAADLAIHHLARPADARAGFLRTLSLLEGMDAPQAYELRFQASIELGRLALRDAAAPDKGLAEARRRLDDASAIPEAEYGGAYRDARHRLLESAIRLHEADPERAKQARLDLERQSLPAKEEEDWEELARDAAEELRLAPAR